MSENISTMTVVVHLNGRINKDRLLFILPVKKLTKEQIDSIDPRPSKRKIPTHNVPGSIITISGWMNQNYVTRGLYFEKKKKKDIQGGKKGFKNNNQCSISLSEKNISVKISEHTLHITGPTNLKQVEDASKFLMEKIKKAKKFILMLQDDELREKTYSWLKQACIGEKFIKEIEIILSPRISCFESSEYFKLKIPDFIPENIDSELAMFLISYIRDNKREGFEDLSTYLSFLDNIWKNSEIMSDDCSISSIDEVMVNKNYRLGYTIDKIALDKYMHDNDGFFSHYLNQYETNVTIILPHVPDEIVLGKRKINKKKDEKHTFLVYTLGTVTQSSPSIKSSEEAYHHFMNTVSKIRHFIDMDQKDSSSSPSEGTGSFDC